MTYRISYQSKAEGQLMELKHCNEKKHHKVQQKLNRLKENPRYPSLETHKVHSWMGPNNEPIFEAYVDKQAKASPTLRILFYYGSSNTLVVVEIREHL